MSTSFDDLRKLPLPERLKLVESLWDSIAADLDALPLTQKQADELDRRLAVYEKDPRKGVSWDELRDRLSKK